MKYPVIPEDDGTDRPRNPYGEHYQQEVAAQKTIAAKNHQKSID
jgi:hypothetical protein